LTEIQIITSVLTHRLVEYKFTKPIQSFRVACCIKRSSFGRIVSLFSNFVMPHDHTAVLIPAADLSVPISLLITRISKIKNPSPDELKLKIGEYFFLNPLSSFPIFPLMTIVPYSYLLLIFCNVSALINIKSILMLC
jgi:hypothetical protein